MRKQGIKVSDAVSEALKSMEESDFMRNVSLDLRIARYNVDCYLAL